MSSQIFAEDPKISQVLSKQLKNSLFFLDKNICLDFYVDEIKESVWQGVCKAKLGRQELAAVVEVSCVSKIATELIRKIQIQLPIKC